VALVDAAVRSWPKRHKAPGARDRLRLAGRIAGELAAGGVEEVILHELTRDLQDAGSAISVIMGARTTTEGWGKPTDPRPDHSRYEISSTVPWCGLCDERTRMVVIRDIDTGEERPGRCRRPVVDSSGAMVACNPNTIPVSPGPEANSDGQEHEPHAPTPELEEISPEEFEAMVQASLERPKASREELLAVAREKIAAGAERAKGGR
jgi:hypothetical protein